MQIPLKMGNLLRLLAFSRHLLTFYSLLNTGISITNHALTIPLFTLLPTGLLSHPLPELLVTNTVVFIFLLTDPHCQLFRVRRALNTQLLFPFLNCNLLGSIIH